MFVVNLDTVASIGSAWMSLFDNLIEEVVEVFVLCLSVVSMNQPTPSDLTHLSHAASEGNALGFLQNTFRVKSAVHSMVGILVNECAQLCLNLKLDISADNFAHVGNVDDVDKQEVGHSSGDLLVWLDTCDTGLPSTKNVLRSGFGWRSRGSRWVGSC